MTYVASSLCKFAIFIITNFTASIATAKCWKMACECVRVTLDNKTQQEKSAESQLQTPAYAGTAHSSPFPPWRPGSLAPPAPSPQSPAAAGSPLSAPCTHVNTSTRSDGKVPAPSTHINKSTQFDGKVPASCTHNTSTRSDGKVPAPCTHINTVWWKVSAPCTHINMVWWKGLCFLHTHQHINMVWQKGLCSLHTQHNLMERSHSLHTHQHTLNKDQCLLAPILLTKSPPQAAVSTLQILLKNQSAWYQMIRSACLPSDISQSSVQCFLDSTITTCPLCALMHKDVNARKVHT